MADQADANDPGLLMTPTELWSHRGLCCPASEQVCLQEGAKKMLGHLPAGTCLSSQVAMQGAHGHTVCVARSDYMETRDVYAWDPLRTSLLCRRR